MSESGAAFTLFLFFFFGRNRRWMIGFPIYFFVLLNWIEISSVSYISFVITTDFIIINNNNNNNNKKKPNKNRRK